MDGSHCRALTVPGGRRMHHRHQAFTHSHDMNRVTLSLLVVGLLSSVAPAQSTPARESVPRYSRVTSVRELPGGRVVVADAGLSRVDVLSPELRFIGAAARSGEGPLEFQSSDWLVAAGGDSTLIVDDVGANLLVLDASLRAVGKRPLRRVTSGTRTLLAEVRGSDALGRLYFTGIRPNITPGAPRDSVPLLRWAPTTDLIDTLTWIRVPVPGLRRSEVNPDSMIQVPADPWEWRDAWSVAPDGRVAVVRGDDYHLEWFANNRKVASGRAVWVSRVPVSAEDVQKLRDTKFTISTPQGPRTISAASGAQLSTVKPFVAEGAPPRVDPDGRVWVERSRASGDAVATYDVFDATGEAVLTVQLADRAHVVGFGGDATYVTKPVADGRHEVAKGRRLRR